MSKSDFIPRSDHELQPWAEHFVTHAKPEYGVSEDKLANLKLLTDALRSSMVAADNAIALARQAVAEKNANRQRVVNEFRAEIRRVKAHAGYNESIGKQLGIEGSLVISDLDNLAPALTTVDKTGGKVVLSFAKRDSDGINLYCQRENDIDWVLLGRATQSPFTDNRPLLQAGKPELRRYSAVFMLHDQEVGNFSDDAVISCSP